MHTSKEKPQGKPAKKKAATRKEATQRQPNTKQVKTNPVKTIYSQNDIKRDLTYIVKAYSMLEKVKRSANVYDIGLDGSTVRVLHGVDKVKDKIIKNWVQKKLDSDNKLIQKNDFKAFHQSLVNSLQNEFSKTSVKYNSNNGVPWSVCAKITDLILFHGLSHKPDLQKYFRQNGFMPLDKYTLIALKHLFKLFLYNSNKDTVKDFFKKEKYLSMGSLSKYTNNSIAMERKLYYDIQEEIKDLIKTLGIKNLNAFHIDRLTWKNGLFSDMEM